MSDAREPILTLSPGGARGLSVLFARFAECCDVILEAYPVEEAARCPTVEVHGHAVIAQWQKGGVDLLIGFYATDHVRWGICPSKGPPSIAYGNLGSKSGAADVFDQFLRAAEEQATRRPWWSVFTRRSAA